MKIQSTKGQILFFALLFAALAVRAQNWQYLGGADYGQASLYTSYYNDIAIDPSGTPYIVYNDALLGYLGTVRKFNGINWENVGTPGMSPYYADYTSIAIDGSGTPYVAYYDYLVAGKASVKKFNGNSWVNVGTQGFSTGAATYTTLAIDGTNTPYIAYADGGTSGRIIVRKFSGSSWTNVGGTTWSTPNSGYPSIAFDNTGALYAAYKDGTTGKAAIKKFNGTNWVNIGSSATISPGAGDYVSLAVQGVTPYVVYADGSNTAKATVRKYNGSAWIDLGSPGFSPTQVTDNAIAIDGSGNPYVLFKDFGASGKSLVMKYNGTAWVNSNPAALSAGTTSYNAITLSASGVPYIIYSDNGIEGKATVKKYNGSSWERVGPVSMSLGSAPYGRVAVSSGGVLHIVYQAYGTGKATVKKYIAGTWDTLGLDGFSDGMVFYTTLAINRADTPYVAYYDATASGKAVVKKYNGLAWVDVGAAASFAGSNVSYLSMAFDTSGLPYLAYRDDNVSQKLIVKKFNGSAWINAGTTAAITSGSVTGSSIVVDANNIPYVAYQDGVSGAINVKKFNGTSWVLVGAANFSDGGADNVSLALGVNDTLLIGYRDYAHGAGVTVKKFNGSGWVTLGSEDLSAGYSDYVSLQADASGKPYVAYQDYNNGYKTTVRKFNGSTWVPLGTVGISAGTSTYQSLAIYNNSIFTTYDLYGAWAQVYHDCSTPTLAVSSSTATAICPGTAVTYTASAVNGGINPVYQWFRNGTQVSGGANDSVFIDNLPANGDVVYCIITNACGADTAAAGAVTVNNPAFIATDPASATVCAAATATFTVSITGTPAPSVQWQVSSNGGSSWSTLSGAVSNVLSFAPSLSDNGKKYRVIASNGCGADTSAAATLSVSPFAVISSDPVPDTACQGTPYSFSVAASGPVTAVQWQYSYDGLSWSALPGATSTTLTGTANYYDDGIQYRALVSNSCGADTSASALLTVRSGPSFNTNSSSASVVAGTTVSMWVDITGGTPPFSYDWERSTDGGVNWNLLPGATDSVYSLTATAAQNGYYYRAVVSNSCGLALGSEIILTVTGGTPSIVVSADHTVICSGETVNFTSLLGNVSGTPSYQWLKNGGPVAGATNASYSTSAISNGDQFSCDMVVNGTMYGSNAITITKFNSPTAVISPGGAQNVCTGQTMIFNSNSGSGLSFQWLNSGSTIAGATNNSYTASATGIYSVTVTNLNNCSNTSAAVPVTVGSCAPVVASLSTVNLCQGGTVDISYNAPGTYNAGNIFTAQLSNASGSFASPVAIGTITATTGGTISANIVTGQNAGTGYRIRIVSSNPATTGTDNGSNLTVNVRTTAAQAAITNTGALSFCQGGSTLLSVPPTPGFSYQWYVNNVAIAGATANSYNAAVSGVYFADVFNLAGCFRSSGSKTVTVNAQPTATIAPNVTQNLCAGQSAALQANTGIGLTYKWLSNGVLISGATTSAYTATASASYSVQVTNSNGCIATSAPVTVNINPLPNVQITASGATSFCAGGNVSLNASGANTYTWSTSASGSSLTVSSSGSFTVTGTDGNGCIATSVPFSVTVNPLPPATISPNTTQTLCTGSVVTFQANTGTGLSYQWFNNNIIIAGATNSSYPANAAGSYKVQVVNSTNCSAASPSVSVTAANCGPGIVSLSTNTLCQGGTVNVTFSANGVYNAGNVFTAQLSNSSGTFGASPTVIGTLSSTTGGVVAGEIGNNQGAGSGYRIRIVASNPALTGADNGTNLTVNARPTAAQASIGNTGALTFCQGGSTLLSVTATAGFSYQWYQNNSLIAGATGSNYSATAPGVYFAEVITPAGCSRPSGNKTVVVNALPPATIVPNTNQNLCAGQTAALQAPTGSGLTYKWFLNSAQIAGATASSYAASAAGSYTVQVTNGNGCSATSAPVTINVSALPVATISPNTAQSVCSGQSLTFTANTSTGLSYLWLNNGTPISGATANSFNTDAAGSYAVQVVNASGCSATSSAVALAVVSCGAAITDTGTRKVCQGGIVTVNFSGTNFNQGNVFTLQLSDNTGSFANAQSIGTLAGMAAGSLSGVIPALTPAGSGYKLRITSSNPVTTGNAGLISLTVQSVLADTINLCAVTVDPVTGKNLLVWNKPANPDIDSFIIYRNTALAGVYQRVGAQKYSIFSTYEDSGADPSVQAQRYYITAKNSCGETAPGSKHHTIHLTISRGQDAATWNLIWNGYEGFAHGGYSIWRGVSAANMSLLASVEANAFNSYTDFSAPSGTVYYMVSVTDAPSCTPSAKTTGGFGISSNVATNAGSLPEAVWTDMQVFPNPSPGSAQVIIRSNDAAAAFEIRIVDLTGRVLERYDAKSAAAVRFGSNLAAGVYTIEVSGNGQRIVRKWMKE